MFKHALSVLALLALALGAPLFAAQAQNFDSIPAGNDTAPDPTENQAPVPPQPSPAQAAKGECGDDPRLEGELLEIMQSDKPITPPLTVTPETFINLAPEILARLGGQMVICPNNPVLKSGKPMRKVAAPFEAIWDNLRKAAIAGDEARVTQILTSYTAAPKTTQEIVNILAPVDLDDKVKAALYKTAGINLSKNTGGLMTDFYAVFGGKSSDSKAVYLLGGSDYPKEFSGEDNEELRKGYIFLFNISPSSNSTRAEYADSLRRLGVNTRHQY